MELPGQIDSFPQAPGTALHPDAPGSGHRSRRSWQAPPIYTSSNGGTFFRKWFRIMGIPYFSEDYNRKIPIGLSIDGFNAFLTVSVQLLSSSRQFDVLYAPFGVLRCADMSLSTAECIS